MTCFRFYSSYVESTYHLGVTLSDTTPKDLERRVAYAQQYVAQYRYSLRKDARRLAVEVLAIYPKLAWTPHKTRLRRALTLAIQGEEIPKEIRIEAHMLLRNALNSYEVNRYRRALYGV